MPLESPSGRQHRKTRKWAWALAVILVGGFAIFFWGRDILLSPDRHSSTVLVLDNCDGDFRTPPFEDAVIAFGPNGKSSRLLTNLNICQTVGGGRSLSASHDGRFFVVCETVGNHLTAYDTRRGTPLWSLDGEFTSATVAQDGTVYAIISAGTIYGKQTIVIDKQGHITKDAPTAGFDMALDAERRVLWLVGKSVKKCDLELTVLLELNPIKWCAASVDINSDGSVWVAERDHPDVPQSKDRILRISSSGEVLKTVDLAWSPLCVRVDHSDGSVWVTGAGTSKPVTQRLLEATERKTGRLPIGKRMRDFLTNTRVFPTTEKHDPDGKLLCRIAQGGHTLDIDPSDGSVWLAGRDKIYHYSREGKKLGSFGGVSADQKYIVVVPEKGAEAAGPKPPEDRTTNLATWQKQPQNQR